MAEDLTAVVRSKFGPAAADYAASDVHAKGESLARIVELVAPQKTWAALDVATGAGHTAAVFAPHVASVIASDITDEMLGEAAKLATSRGLANMSTATAAADALPFPDESFDLVCCRLAAHHFPRIEDFVREVLRVLKKGGRFALVDNVAPDRSSGCRAPARMKSKTSSWPTMPLKNFATRATASRRRRNSGLISLKTTASQS